MPSKVSVQNDAMQSGQRAVVEIALATLHVQQLDMGKPAIDLKEPCSEEAR